MSTACTINCGAGKFGKFDSNGKPICDVCQIPCGNCLSTTSCLTCLTGLLVYGGTTCPANCPDGQYSDTPATCALCDNNCATCNNLAITCLSCGIQAGAQSYLYSDHVCYVNCPPGTYKKSLDNTCQDCDGSCNGCLDSATSCVHCAVSNFRVIGDTTCTTDCGDGFYGDTRLKVCAACPIGC